MRQLVNILQLNFRLVMPFNFLTRKILQAAHRKHTIQNQSGIISMWKFTNSHRNTNTSVICPILLILHINITDIEHEKQAGREEIRALSKLTALKGLGFRIKLDP